MKTLILFGVIVAAEVVADKIITTLDDRRTAKSDAPKNWAGQTLQAGKQDFIDKLVGELTPEQKRYYELVRDKLTGNLPTDRQFNDWLREKLSRSQTSDAPKGPVTQEFGKPPTGWGAPYGHTPFGPPYREQGFLPDYKTYPSRDA